MIALLPLRMASSKACLIHARLAALRSAYSVSMSGVRPRLLTADYVECHEQHLTVGPTHVLAELGVLAVFTLARQPYGALAEALIALKKHLAEFGQSLQRIIRARLGPVTIGPLVVAGDKDKGMTGSLRQPQTMLKRLVTARRKSPGLLGPPPAVPPEITIMHNKGDISRVD